MDTILVVDDEPNFRSALQIHYRQRGYRVLEAEDGQVGLEVFLANRHQIDLVITDIRMPRLNGEDLMRMLRAADSLVPFLGVTGEQDVKDQLAVLGSGAYYYLTKPLPNWAIVDRLVSNAITQHKARRSELASARLVRAYVRTNGQQEATAGGVEVAIEQIDAPKPSGDFAEAFRASDGDLVFYLADVAGHASIVLGFVACLTSIALHRAHHGDHPALSGVLETVDAELKKLREHGVLAQRDNLSIFLGRIHGDTRRLSYVNAGHPEAFLFRADGRVEKLPATNLIVGTPLPFRAVAKDVELAPGDQLFLYSDGAYEQFEAGEVGADEAKAHLQELVALYAGGPARNLVEQVTAELIARAGGAEKFEDDTTVMAVRLLPE